MQVNGVDHGGLQNDSGFLRRALAVKYRNPKPFHPLGARLAILRARVFRPLPLLLFWVRAAALQMVAQDFGERFPPQSSFRRAMILRICQCFGAPDATWPSQSSSSLKYTSSVLSDNNDFAAAAP
jgi:hypothetical protein